MGHLHTGQELGEVVVHKLGAWYETQKGVVFRLGNQPQRCRDGRHTSLVQLLDGRVCMLAWRPETTRLRSSWLVRVWRSATRSRVVTAESSEPKGL